MENQCSARVSEDVATAERLTAAWRDAIANVPATDYDEAEQNAYDRLIDHLEAAGLNYTQWDPRPHHHHPEV